MDLNQDVLQEICNQIGLCLDLADDNRKAIARRTLASVALANKAFYEPAIRALWRVLPNLIPLLKLLPSFQLITGSKYVLGDVKSHEWQRFDDHARHVQVVLLAATRFQVSPFVYVRLRQLRTNPLFPALRKLRIPANYKGDLGSSFICLSPQLRVVGLDHNSVAKAEFLLQFIPAIVAEAPLVTRLIFHTGVDVDLGGISNLKCLQHLDLVVPAVCLSNTFIQQMGHLKTLFSFHVFVLGRSHDLNRIDQEPKKSTSVDNSMANAYCKLQTLVISGSPITITKLLEAMSFASLSFVRLGFNTVDILEASLEDVCKTLAGKSTRVRVVSLRSYGILHIDWMFDWIRPLLLIHTLEMLAIDTKSFSISEGQFFWLMSSLPNLTTLHLPSTSQSTSLTLQVLWQPSKFAPMLTKLKICIYHDDEQGPPFPSNLKEIRISRQDAHFALRNLSISSAYGNLQDRDVIHLARLLYRAFPNLDIVEGFGPNTHRESWARVDMFRAALVMCVREDE